MSEFDAALCRISDRALVALLRKMMEEVKDESQRTNGTER